MTAAQTPSNASPDPPKPDKSGEAGLKQPDPVPIATHGRAALLFVLSQLPVIGGGVSAVLNTSLATWAKDHPVAATLIVVGYEVLLLVGGVLKKVWGNLEQGVVDGLTEGTRLLAGAARARLLNLVSRYRRRYLAQVVLSHRNFNVRGLRTQGTFAIRLEHVFVELRIAPNSAQQASLSPLGGKDLSGHRPIWDFLRQTAKSEGEALAIIGAPGSGKTTLLQSIALTLAANRQRRYALRAYVPLLLFLRDHAVVIASGSPPSLGELAFAHFAKKPGFSGAPPAWFERQLKAGTCMVLLDGLDEVADEATRARVSAWVDQQIVTYPRSAFVLTARPRGYATSPLARAHALEVLPFGTEQVRSFVHGWYRANEIMRAGGQEDEGVRQEAEKQAQDLLGRLRARPALGDLTRNPLLLTMIATVHSHRNALPGGRVELYGEICDVLLGHWQRAKGLDQPLSAGQLRSVLEPLALHMMQERVRELRTAEVRAVIEGPLAEVGVVGQAVTGFLQALQVSSGLFVEREKDSWGFAHLSFQEYLASAHLRKQGGHVDWTGHVQDAWWHETLRLYAAQGDATALLQACLKLDDVAALALASECLEEAQRIEPELRKDVEQRLVEDLASPDERRWRIAAEVRLRRRLNAFQRIDDDREIDPGYVTCAEYQLFLEDQRREGTPTQPDHWMGERFEPELATAPVAGVRFEDAKSFAEWLTARQGGDAVFRIPTPYEAAEHAVDGVSRMATWCSDRGVGRLRGITTAEEQSLRSRMALLTTVPAQELTLEALAVDFRRAVMLGQDTSLDACLARALGLDLGLTHELDSSLVRTLVSDIESAHDLSSSRVHNRAMDLAYSPGLERNLEISLGLTPGADLVRALIHALKQLIADPSHSPLSPTTIAHALAFARVLACAGSPVRYSPLRRTIADDLRLAYAYAFEVMGTIRRARMPSDSEWRVILDFSERRMMLLIDLLELMTASDSSRPALYRYMAHLLEYVWAGFESYAPQVVRPWHHRWVRSVAAWLKAVFADVAEAQVTYQRRDDIRALHAWCRLTASRLDGGFPAWEGIRLVREHHS